MDLRQTEVPYPLGWCLLIQQTSFSFGFFGLTVCKAYELGTMENKGKNRYRMSTRLMMWLHIGFNARMRTNQKITACREDAR